MTPVLQDLTIRAATVLVNLVGVPWPPVEATVVIERQFNDGRMRMTAEPPGKIRVVVVQTCQGKERVLIDQSTCQLVALEPIDIAIATGWTGENISIVVNGDIVACTEHPDTIPESCAIKKRAIALEPREEFKGQNSEAVKKRRERLTSWNPKVDRIPGDKNYAFSALQADTLQLIDLIELVQSGKAHHALGLSALLRKLVSLGKPLPLLQLCAALLDEPLIVYTVDHPSKLLPYNPTFAVNFSIWSRQRQGVSNPVDLDVWLQLPGGQIDGLHFNQDKILRSIADTIGSHLDWDSLPEVVLLKGGASEMGSIKRDDLITYLGRLADATLRLSEEILQKA